MTELQCKVADECVQLHGGYGYMWEYGVARAWADARVQRIYAGTNEIMKELIARKILTEKEFVKEILPPFRIFLINYSFLIINCSGISKNTSIPLGNII